MTKIEEMLENYAINTVKLLNGTVSIEELDNNRNEILTRFSVLEAKVQELERRNKNLFQEHGLLKIDNDYNQRYLKSAEELITKLEQQANNLKCCGNCKSIDNDYPKCSILGKITVKNVCPNWQSDNMKRSERNGNE